jgi:hypothetical protein
MRLGLHGAFVALSMGIDGHGDVGSILTVSVETSCLPVPIPDMSELVFPVVMQST